MRLGLSVMDAAVPVAADRAPVLDEDAFRAFYDRTARPVWAYLHRLTRDPALADDLLQESFYRLLRARVAFESDEHRAHYLFRIAANLASDAYRRRAPERVPFTEADEAVHGEDQLARTAEARADLARALATLAPRDRDMLWLAYADGASHADIARHLGVGRPSIKAMLARARQRLAARLRGEAARPAGGRRP